LADILPANGMSSMWTSKLGNKYPREQIDKLDNEHHRVLQQLRKKPANAICADCGENETTWASVSLGVFVCVHCADVHRAVGTHISKIKGCSGTYLWGPDEISRMQQLGNAAVRAQLGRINDECRPEKSATKEERVALCRKKYEDRNVNVGESRHSSNRSQFAPASVQVQIVGGLPWSELAKTDDFLKDIEAGHPDTVVGEGQQGSTSRVAQDGQPFAQSESIKSAQGLKRHCSSVPPVVASARDVFTTKCVPTSRSRVLTVLDSSFDDFFKGLEDAHSDASQSLVDPSKRESADFHLFDASTTVSDDQSDLISERWCLVGEEPSAVSMRLKDGAPQEVQVELLPGNLTQMWDAFGEW